MAEKIIRDPVHDVIAFRTDQPLDRLLFGLLNAAEFQRLRRILQLGMTHLAYPGATHSRYAHSLGVLETARKMLGHIERHTPVSDEQRTLCLVSALLHDLGHGPFSHVFERVSNFPHEKLTLRVIQDPDSEVHRLLWQHDRLLPEKVAAFFGARDGERTFLNDVISSQLDADRFDYLLRDNHMTGSRYGQFDLQWLLHALDVESNRLVVTGKGASAVEDYLHARYNMYRNVYFHKVVRSAEGMVRLALQRAKRLAVQDRLTWPPRESSTHKALLGQRLSIEQFTDLDDVAVNYCFKLWSTGDDATLARLCRGLLFRKVYKTIDLSHVPDPAEARAMYERAADAVERAGGDRHYDLFYDEPADTPYEADVEHAADDESDILIRGRDGALTPFGRTSPLPKALGERLMFRRIHVAPEHAEAARAAVGP
ncbi:MAG TPA: HD domain-containing protein [Tepidisphaeraceae bacterium]|nr:HD domain-containing protein [Tepidisphaeraceae bacterium]